MQLIANIRQIAEIESVSITTNGYFLKNYAEDLQHAGVSSINVSIDTLDPQRYRMISGSDGLNQVLEGLHKAAHTALPIKLNVTVTEHLTVDDIFDLTAYSMCNRFIIRFIELMPIGCGHITNIRNDQILALLTSRYRLEKSELRSNGPAVYYHAENKGTVGFISAIHQCFCGSCNRIRLTADGLVKPCLASSAGFDILNPLRKGVPEYVLQNLLRAAVRAKPEQHFFTKRKVREYRCMNMIGG